MIMIITVILDSSFHDHFPIWLVQDNYEIWSEVLKTKDLYNLKYHFIIFSQMPSYLESQQKNETTCCSSFYLLLLVVLDINFQSNLLHLPFISLHLLKAIPWKELSWRRIPIQGRRQEWQKRPGKKILRHYIRDWTWIWWMHIRMNPVSVIRDLLLWMEVCLLIDGKWYPKDTWLRGLFCCGRSGDEFRIIKYNARIVSRRPHFSWGLTASNLQAKNKESSLLLLYPCLPVLFFPLFLRLKWIWFISVSSDSCRTLLLHWKVFSNGRGIFLTQSLPLNLNSGQEKWQLVDWQNNDSALLF